MTPFLGLGDSFTTLIFISFFKNKKRGDNQSRWWRRNLSTHAVGALHYRLFFLHTALRKKLVYTKNV